VTAQDGITTRTYTVTAPRTGLGENPLNQSSISTNEKLVNSLMVNDGLTVHPGLSPNGDGINDFLYIEGISRYPDNELTIMNRSGLIVFEAKGYDNMSKVFDGHSNKTGVMQLPGTYFYSLQYKAGSSYKYKTGFIILKY
jgi:gliding motility-associated-like protein